MSESAKALARSVLAEAYDGPAAGVLRKYHLLDERGELRTVTIGADPAKGKEGVTGPIIDPSVIDRFLALDPSRSKKVFEWIIFASGGGEPKLKESERALELAKNWVIENRMKGLGRNEEKIKPMSRAEAEADWQANDFPRYHEAYYFADEDLASDVQYPVFGWYRQWPGRGNVYEKVVNAVEKWKLFANDKKFIQQWNKSNPKEPFQLSLWKPDGTPLFGDADALLDFVNQIRSTLAKRKAEQNVVLVGKNPEGGYRKGRDEVLYSDDNLDMYVPLTAAASLKRGFNNWCVANRTRFDTYFRTRQQGDLLWGSYTQRGPFAYVHFKQPVGEYLKTIALHVQLNAQPNTGGRIEFWDEQNHAAVTYQSIVNRLRTLPNGKRSLDTAIGELEKYLETFTADCLERYPALEALARQLVNDLLDG